MIRFLCVVFVMGILCTRLSAQISPGELSTAHAQLEGVDNCTQCHSVGKALSDESCTNCHREIKARIDLKRGYHATIGGKHCFDCHKEHHGRQFEIVRFDRSTFNHATVGFVLEGKHGKTACEKCHTKDRIAAKDIQMFSDARKQRTLLGLSQECVSCHMDQHRGQFTKPCISCHVFDGWKPASKFSHTTAKYQLTGKHEKVECLSCHKNKLGGGTTVQYVGMEFSTCQSCHADPHKGKFQKPCASCHTTDGFKQIKGAQFNHALTEFPLRGKHADLKCDKCHANDTRAVNASGETGFHITKYKQCRNCHADAHLRQFDNRKDGGTCESCHTETSFTVVTFSVQDHARTAFALTGGHIAVPCAKCHEAGKVKAKSTRQFRWDEKVVCTTCHSDVHKGQFAAKMTDGCVTCHTTDAWQTVLFKHDATRFPLRGKHATVACDQCHKKQASAGAAVRYVGTTMVCYDCHTDNHDQQFAVGGVTRCERCHTEKSWNALLFNHETQSQFSLSGKHATVPCASCHKPTVVKGRTVVRYKPLGRACIDCHQTK